MFKVANARWVPLAVVLALLVGVVAPAAPLSAAPQKSKQGGAAKKKRNAAAAKRLQRQRQRLQKQRQRLQKQQLRFKAQQERQRKKLDEEKKANEDEGTEIWNGFFPWVTAGDFSDNLPTGLGLAGVGIAGALILIFGFLGSFLPSMGGKAEYETLLLEIEKLRKRRDNQLEPRERYVRSGAKFAPEQRQEATNLTHDLGQIIKSKEEEASRKYRQMMWLGIPLYIVIGGALAVLLASNALQALLIGFAWTSIVDRLGLKKELAEKKDRHGEEADKLAKVAKEGELAKEELAEKEGEMDAMKQALSDLTETAAKLKAS